MGNLSKVFECPEVLQQPELTLTQTADDLAYRIVLLSGSACFEQTTLLQKRCNSQI